MKKLILILTMVVALSCNAMTFAVEENSFDEGHSQVVAVSGEDDRPRIETKDEPNESKEEITDASEKILENMSKKERKIAKYTDKYNNKTLAYTAYGLDVAQLYSIPVFIILITWGAFNCYIIGEKKLDKREHGFAMIVAGLVGLVVFQVLPFLFALLVIGK
mgnify:CR=1 FL=1